MSDLFHFWWQAPAGGGGAVIVNSLRFRGAQTLSRAVAGSGTMSVWIKRGKLGTAQTIAPNIAFAADNTLNGSTALFRDPSAWMHIVVNNGNTWVNNHRVSGGTAPTIGTLGTSFDGYMAELHFVDGQALAPTDFGEFNADGAWVPKKVSGVTYGVNDYYLDFSDAADIGADRSGNGNDFTPTGFELADTTSTLYDWMADSPTNNFSTFNPLVRTGEIDTTYSNANLKAALSTNSSGTPANPAYSTIEIPKTGKYYIEWISGGNTNFRARTTPVYLGQVAESGWSFNESTRNGGTPEITGSATGTNSTGSWSIHPTGTVYGIEWDMDSNTIKYTANGTLVLTQSNCNFADFPQIYFWLGSETNSITGMQVFFNPGQQPFQHQPAGTQGLAAVNMPAVAITNPSDHFTTILDSGANILTEAQKKFPNGLWWIKDRVGNWSHRLVDSVNGTGKARRCPDNNDTAYTAPSGNSVAWCWATGPSGADNGGGFSITSGTHGLGETPMFVISRNLSVWHKDIPAGKGMVLANNGGPVAQSWTVNATTVSGPGGGPYWAWKDIPGYSAAGTYTGNANAHGPFVYTGFRPAFVMIKLLGGSFGWVMKDSARKPYNPADDIMRANLSKAETPSTSSDIIDILSNGFKCTSLGSETNGGSQHYIWIAFAEHPFGGSNVSPSPAR